MRKPAIPPVIVELATCIELNGTEGSFKWRKKDLVSLGCNVKGTRLYLSVAPDNRVRVSREDEQIKQAKRLYKSFTRNHATHDLKIGRAPEGLKRFGLAESIVYDSDKFGSPARYIHEFETRPRIWIGTGKRPAIIVVEGGALEVTKEGIIG